VQDSFGVNEYLVEARGGGGTDQTSIDTPAGRSSDSSSDERFVSIHQGYG